MDHQSRLNPSDGAGSPRRKGRWRVVWVLLALLAVQSITITLPIHGRVVDAATGQAVPRAAVAAIWQLDAYGFERLPGGAVKIAETVTGDHGEFRFPLAFMIHVPLLPFTALARSDTDMPLLIVAADGYQPYSENNDVFGMSGPPHGAGFLSVRTSSLQDSTLRLTRLPPAPATRRQRLDHENILSSVRSAMDSATGSCAQRAFCNDHSLKELRAAMARGEQWGRPY